jgi:hypothetical protein
VKSSTLGRKVPISGGKFRSRVESSGLGWKVPVSGGKFQSRVESSGLGRKVPGYAPRQCACKIPLQACCGPGILGNQFSSVRAR